jgi:hypothetical protein
MKKAAVIFIAIACVLSLAACSSSDSDSGRAYGGATTDSAPRVNSDGGGMSEPRQLSNAAPAEQARKIIRNASMTIEAEDAAELYNSLNEFNRSLGGYEFSQQISHFDTYSSVDAVLKVPPDRLDEFMSFAGENGRIIRSSTTSDDVTDQYFDMQTRVEIKRRSLESYYIMLERVETAEEIITLQRTIDGIIEEIEAFEGRLRVLDSLIDMATVHLYISQRNDPVLERREIDWSALSFDDMGYFIRTGFISVISTIAAAAQWTLIALIVSLPIWLIPAVIVVVLIKRRKKKKANIQVSEQEPPPK